jgi:hypothetical protein
VWGGRLDTGMLLYILDSRAARVMIGAAPTHGNAEHVINK